MLEAGGSLVAGWWLSCKVPPGRGRHFSAGVQPGQLAAPHTVPGHHVRDTTSALWCSWGHVHTRTHAHTHWSATLVPGIGQSGSVAHFYSRTTCLNCLFSVQFKHPSSIFVSSISDVKFWCASHIIASESLEQKPVWTRSAFRAQHLTVFANKACILLGDSYSPTWLCWNETLPFNSLF